MKRISDQIGLLQILLQKSCLVFMKSMYYDDRLYELVRLSFLSGGGNLLMSECYPVLVFYLLEPVPC